MSNLLYDEHPLEINPTLATLIGLNEAVMLQQIHYWLKIKESNGDPKFYHYNRWWVYNTYDEWAEQFPFWSSRTIKRIVKSLTEMKLLEIDRFNEKGYDNTNWYSINYEVLESLKLQESAILSPREVTKLHSAEGQSFPPYTKDYPKDFNKDCLKGYKGFARCKTMSVLERNIRKVCKEDDYNTELCLEVIPYYFDKYKQYLGKGHPKVSNENLSKIAYKITYGTDDVYDLDAESWAILIDKHFKTNYGVAQDWNINFFLNDEVINNRYYETLY